MTDPLHEPTLPGAHQLLDDARDAARRGNGRRTEMLLRSALLRIDGHGEEARQ